MAAARALKPQLYPVYREARQSSSAFSVLCHGQPTLDNILFRYDEAGNPVEAKVRQEDTGRVNNHNQVTTFVLQFVNFSNARIASSMSDLLVFINSSQANVSREDFLLR